MNKEELINILKFAINDARTILNDNESVIPNIEEEAEDYILQIKFPNFTKFLTASLCLYSISNFVDLLNCINNNNLDKIPVKFASFGLCTIIYAMNLYKRFFSEQLLIEYEKANKKINDSIEKINASKMAIEFIEGLTKEEAEKYLKFKM